MLEYIDFLTQERDKSVAFMKQAVDRMDYVEAGQLQSDISMLSWIIDDMTKFNLSGRHL